MKAHIRALFCLILISLSLPALAIHDGFEQIFEKHHVVMLLINPKNGQIVRANKAASLFYGYDPSQLENMSIQRINALSKQAVAEERALAAKENRNYFIFRHKKASGSIHTVEVSSVPMKYHNETVLFSIIRDISEFRKTEDSLWHYQNRLEEMVSEQLESLKKSESSIRIQLLAIIGLLIVGAAGLMISLQKSKLMRNNLAYEKQRLNEVIWSTNVGTWEKHIPSGRVLINKRWAEMLGYKLDELIPITHACRTRLIHPEDLPLADQRLQQHYDGELEAYECEMRMQHKEGHWIWVLDKGKIVQRDSKNRPIRMVGTHQDISEQKQASDQLQHLAHHDQLTDLPNRALFYDRFQQAVLMANRNNTALAMLFIDLDGFKAINDNYGHSSGDQVLTTIAQRLSSTVRQSDTVGRMGGDEFAVLLHSLHHKEDASLLAEKIILHINEPILLSNGLPVSLSCSIGIALYPEHSANPNALIQQADTAMYQAKHSGKGRYCLTGSDICHSPIS